MSSHTRAQINTITVDKSIGMNVWEVKNELRNMFLYFVFFVNTTWAFSRIVELVCASLDSDISEIMHAFTYLNIIKFREITIFRQCMLTRLSYIQKRLEALKFLVSDINNKSDRQEKVELFNKVFKEAADIYMDFYGFLLKMKRISNNTSKLLDKDNQAHTIETEKEIKIFQALLDYLCAQREVVNLAMQKSQLMANKGYPYNFNFYNYQELRDCDIEICIIKTDIIKKHNHLQNCCDLKEKAICYL